METRKPGAAELQIAPLVLGGNVFGLTADEATSFAILDAFLEAGFNAVGTIVSFRACRTVSPNRSSANG